VDNGVKDKLAGSRRERMEEDRIPKKNWKGRDEEEDPGKDGEK
jgi:hypothetical protein